MSAVFITGTGSVLPAREVTNEDVVKLIPEGSGIDSAWIEARTGIRSRFWVSRERPSETTAHLAARASEGALEAAGRTASEVDLLVVGTATPDTPMPSCAARVAARLGLIGAVAFDVNAACSGFLFALDVAARSVRVGDARCALVVGVDVLSPYLDWNAPKSAVLFGDGAGAVLLEPTLGGSQPHSSMQLKKVQLGTDPSLSEVARIAFGAPSSPISNDRNAALRLEAREVRHAGVHYLKHAVSSLDLEAGPPTWWVPHQANLRMIEQVASELGLPIERFLLRITEEGNTGAASIPRVLDQATRFKIVREGSRVVLFAVGAGFTYAAAELST